MFSYFKCTCSVPVCSASCQQIVLLLGVESGSGSFLPAGGDNQSMQPVWLSSSKTEQAWVILGGSEFFFFIPLPPSDIVLVLLQISAVKYAEEHCAEKHQPRI